MQKSSKFLGKSSDDLEKKREKNHQKKFSYQNLLMWNDNAWKYGTVQLTAMVHQFKCDNDKCKKTIVSILSEYKGDEYYGRCDYCGSGRLKWIRNTNLLELLKKHKIITMQRLYREGDNET